ncbi:alpha/beta hydrolase [Arthrobacter sp. MSA 4-2]|uniref:alpha/beta hydrolase n=1 Tax=Arthrobacter sp. MSA 4-2 TaxID=2794349 RepID=UPI0018E86529|nr:alpha/beta hydrolase [Arthrobacter sp. MSA 4-2]MBJ2119829.1 alpha/beta hydrolase [Arthrobacter sp. MSA 4-2]
MERTWEPDHLGPAYGRLTLDLEPDEEGPCCATLVAHRGVPARRPADRFRRALGAALARASGRTPEPRRIPALLYLHGWSDYFFHTELAEFCAERGIEFFALDLRKYGRSLREWQTPGYVRDLQEYDSDLEAALAAVQEEIRSRHGPGAVVELNLMAHSTGALTAVLWADRHPGRVASLILNSPWLDTQGSALFRNTTQGLLEPLVRFRPKARLRLPEFGYYWRSISSEADGEWNLDRRWRPEFGFPIRAGWLTAVLAGHAAVARGLSLEVPVLVLASARSAVSPTWSTAMLEADSILDVSVMVRRATGLGRRVTLSRFDGALHDVLLSRPEVRAEVYAELDRWLRYAGPAARR